MRGWTRSGPLPCQVWEPTVSATTSSRVMYWYLDIFHPVLSPTFFYPPMSLNYSTYIHRGPDCPGLRNLCTFHPILSQSIPSILRFLYVGTCDTLSSSPGIHPSVPSLDDKPGVGSRLAWYGAPWRGKQKNKTKSPLGARTVGYGWTGRARRTDWPTTHPILVQCSARVMYLQYLPT